MWHIRRFFQEGLSRQSLIVLLIFGCLIFLSMYILSMGVLFISKLIDTVKYTGIQPDQLIPICTSAAIATSAIVALIALHNSRLNSEAPWLINLREFHRDFWNDEKIAQTRMWIRCDIAYRVELKPILDKRFISPSKISIEEYKVLETLDRFCAIMLRVVNADKQPMTRIYRESWENFGYNWWLDEMRKRDEIHIYIKLFWKPLEEKIKEIDSLKGGKNVW